MMSIKYFLFNFLETTDIRLFLLKTLNKIDDDNTLIDIYCFFSSFFQDGSAEVTATPGIALASRFFLATPPFLFLIYWTEGTEVAKISNCSILNVLVLSSWLPLLLQRTTHDGVVYYHHHHHQNRKKIVHNCRLNCHYLCGSPWSIFLLQMKVQINLLQFMRKLL